MYLGLTLSFRISPSSNTERSTLYLTPCILTDKNSSSSCCISGIYYQLAAEYQISRRKLADSQCSVVLSNTSLDLLDTALEYYGHRAWRVGKNEPSDMAKEKEGIDALLCREKKVKHSQMILELLKLSVTQYQLFNCRRMRNKLMIQQAEEMMVTAEYRQALDLLLPCLDTYRQEQWETLTYSVLSLALKCSFLTCDISIYSTLCLELCGLTVSSSWMLEEQKRVWSNFLQIVEGCKAPPPEPSMTAKSERASVGQATKTWNQLLTESHQAPMVDISSFSSCLDVCVEMSSSVELGQEMSVSVVLTYSGHGSVCLTNIQCAFNSDKYDKSDLLSEPVTLTEPTRKIFQFVLRPEPSDVGQNIELKHVNIVLGSREELKVSLIKKPPTSDTSDDHYKTTRWQHVCKVEPQLANLKFLVKRELPALVGEWFTLDIELENTEVTPARDIVLTCYLKDRTDPLITDTTIISQTPSSDDTEEVTESVAAHLDDLDHMIQKNVQFYVQASTGGVREFVLHLSYYSGDVQCSDQKTIEVYVENPFQFSSMYLTEALEATLDCNTDEVFFVSAEVKNTSPHDLEITQAVMEGSHPVTVSSPDSSVTSLDILSQAKTEFMFGCQVSSSAMMLNYDSQTITPGKLVLMWRRRNCEIINKTIFDFPSLKLSRATLYAECILPPFGTLRSQIQAKYTFYNRTQDIQEFLINIDPSDCFMFSGPKQSQVKLFPQDQFTFSLVVYPLICGESQLPKVKISSNDGNSGQAR